MSWTLVTGGAKRLGADICIALAKKGHDLVIHYNTSRNDAESIASICREHGVKAEIIQGSFSTPQLTDSFIRECLNRFPGVKFLINNVGNYEQGPILQTTPNRWNDLFQTNVNAAYALIHALLPSIKKTQGSIINIGTAGIHNMRTAKTCTAYSITKIGLLALTRALAVELAPDHVTVNMVSPGQLEISEDLDISKLPMQRAATLDEVSRVVAFLLDPDNRYITGQNIEIAGGYTL